MGKFIDLTGQKFGRLTVIKRVDNSKMGRVQWLCQCCCGNETKVSSLSLRTQNTQSCGCLYNETRKTIRKSHGYKHSRLYKIWGNMKQRCYNDNVKCYKYYGARGIQVCDEWRNNFKSFYDWAMNNGYRDDLTIDRINVDGDYEPNNCRWATNEEQSNNRRNNHTLTINNETHTTKAWSNILGIPYSTIKSRIKQGWTTENILMTPYTPREYYTIDGVEKTLSEWCNIYSMPYNLIFDRVFRSHWDLKKALLTPIKYKK